MLIKYKDENNEMYSFFKQPDSIPKNWTEYTEEQQKADIKRAEAIRYLEATNYISCNLSDLLTDDDRTAYLDEVSDTYGITNREIIEKRKEYRLELQ